MPESKVCLNAKASLSEIQLLKQMFDETYQLANLSKDAAHIEDFQKAKHLISKEIETLKQTTYSVEIERLLRIRKQYRYQVNLFTELGILESKTEATPSGEHQEVLFIKGIDNIDYPVPSLEDVLAAMSEKKELLKIKADQGFTKFILVPFGMSLKSLIEKVRQTVLIDREKQSFDEDDEPNKAVWVDSACVEADITGDLLYHPRTFNKDQSEGKTKQALLDTQKTSSDRCVGWRALLIQTTGTVRPIARLYDDGTKGELKPRKDIESGRSAVAYLAELLRENYDFHSPYYGESGMTPEDWLTTLIVQLNQDGFPLDDTTHSKHPGTYLIGAYFSTPTAPPKVGVTYWEKLISDSYGLPYLSIFRPTDRSQGYGMRTVVQI